MSETSAGAVAAAHGVYETYKYGGRFSIDEVSEIIQRLAVEPAIAETVLRIDKWHENSEAVKQLRVRLAETEAKLRESREETRKWQRIRTPTHGNCCTCQKCGESHDECRCDLDDVVDELEQTKAKLRAAEERERKAREAFDEFGDHLAMCAIWEEGRERGCTCGYNKALAAGENSDGEG